MLCSRRLRTFQPEGIYRTYRGHEEKIGASPMGDLRNLWTGTHAERRVCGELGSGFRLGMGLGFGLMLERGVGNKGVSYRDPFMGGM